MKKFLSLRNVLLLVGIFLAVLSFFLAFAAKLTTVTSTITNVIIGDQKEIIPNLGTVSVGNQYHSSLSLAGILMIFVAGIIACLLSFFVEEGWAKWVTVILVLVILAGGIMVFFCKEGYAITKVDALINSGSASSSDRSEMIAEELERLNKIGATTGAVPIIVGVFGIVSALAFGIGQFVEE